MTDTTTTAKTDTRSEMIDSMERDARHAYAEGLKLAAGRAVPLSRYVHPLAMTIVTHGMDAPAEVLTGNG